MLSKCIFQIVGDTLKQFTLTQEELEQTVHCIGSEEVFMRHANKINLVDSMEVSDEASAGSTDIVLGGRHRRVTSTDSFNIAPSRPASPRGPRHEEFEAKIFELTSENTAYKRRLEAVEEALVQSREDLDFQLQALKDS